MSDDERDDDAGDSDELADSRHRSVETTTLRDEFDGLRAHGHMAVDDADAKIRLILDEDWDGREYYRHLSLEVTSHGLSFDVSLSVDDADRLQQKLAEYVERAREEQQ